MIETTMPAQAPSYEFRIRPEEAQTFYRQMSGRRGIYTFLADRSRSSRHTFHRHEIGKTESVLSSLKIFSRKEPPIRSKAQAQAKAKAQAQAIESNPMFITFDSAGDSVYQVRFVGAGGEGFVFEAQKVGPDLEPKPGAKPQIIKVLNDECVTRDNDINRKSPVSEAQMLQDALYSGRASRGRFRRSEALSKQKKLPGKSFHRHLLDAAAADKPQKILHFGLQWVFELYMTNVGLGFVHSDIKPENLMLDPVSGDAHLLDWGLTGKNGVADKFRGTQGYIAPESCPSVNKFEPPAIGLSSASDVYALGIALAEIYCRPKGIDIFNKDNDLCQLGQGTNRLASSQVQTNALKALAEIASQLGDDDESALHKNIIKLIRKMIEELDGLSQRIGIQELLPEFIKAYEDLGEGADTKLLDQIKGITGVCSPARRSPRLRNELYRNHHNGNRATKRMKFLIDESIEGLETVLAKLGDDEDNQVLKRDIQALLGTPVDWRTEEEAAAATAPDAADAAASGDASATAPRMIEARPAAVSGDERKPDSLYGLRAEISRCHPFYRSPSFAAGLIVRYQQILDRMGDLKPHPATPSSSKNLLKDLDAKRTGWQRVLDKIKSFLPWLFRGDRTVASYSGTSSFRVFKAVQKIGRENSKELADEFKLVAAPPAGVKAS
jgi:serine/threonine protein kinase